MKVRPRSESPSRTPRQRGARRRAALRVALFALYSAAVATGSVALLESARPTLVHSGLELPSEVARAVLLAPWNAARAHAKPLSIEEIRIDVQFKHMHQIHEKRAAALQAGVLLPSDEDLVPATVRHGSFALPGQLRLRGEQIAGLDGEKWPLRVELDPGAFVFGMRRFSLMDPKARGFQAERFPHEHLRQLGIVSPRTAFVRVVLNGRALGTMLLEEHYTKEFLEAQERREGVVVRWDDRAYWDAIARIGGPGPFDSFRVAELLAFKRGRIDRRSSLSRQRSTAIGLLRGFHEGTLPASEVFDLRLTAEYLAVAELWASASALRWNHMRFYFNPITSRLEPVGTRFNLHMPHPGRGLASFEAEIPSRMLADPELREAFVAAAHRIADDVLDGDLLDGLRALEASDLAALHREYPWQAPFDFGRAERRAGLLRSLRVPGVARFGAASAADPGAATPLRAIVRNRDEGAALELRNTLPVEIRITDVALRRGDDPPRSVAAELSTELPLRVAPTDRGAEPKAAVIELPDLELRRARVQVSARVPGHAAELVITARRGAPRLESNPMPVGSIDAVLDRFGFLRYEEDARRFVAARGRWNVDETLSLPEGVGLLLPAGTELRFAAGTGMVARGELQFLGSQDEPVVLTGPASSERSGLWAGVVVIGAGAPSHWTHVRVHNAGGFRQRGWSPEAGVMFYESDAILEDCRFERSRAERALVVARSTFAMRGVHIERSGADAFGAEFANGTFEGGAIVQAGGDGIDVTGSTVEVQGTHFEYLEDKALSVGEGSEVVVSGVAIRSVGTAFVSKDRSRGEIRDSSIHDVQRVALMAYVKKGEYGAAELVAEDNRIETVGRVALAQTGSRIFIDGAPVPEQDVDVEQLYLEGSRRP